MVDIYPELIGLGFNVTRRPKSSVSIQPHTDGQEIRVGYWGYPLFEWDLTYDVLRDFPREVTPTNSIPSELKRLMGFFLAHQGTAVGFYFRDPDDFQVVGQLLDTGNGERTDFLVLHSFGDIPYGVEGKVAVVPTSFFGPPFTIYLDNVPQPSGWTLVGGPGIWYIRFASPPPVGMILSIDMGYYFYVRFGSDAFDFEKFTAKPGQVMWMIKKLTLVGLKSE